MRGIVITLAIMFISVGVLMAQLGSDIPTDDQLAAVRAQEGGAAGSGIFDIDRKSTRLNSSHLVISYAVFCSNKNKRILVFFPLAETFSPNLVPSARHRNRTRLLRNTANVLTVLVHTLTTLPHPPILLLLLML